MEPRKDAQLRVGDWVRDNKGEMGRGRVVQLESFGAMIEWEKKPRSFLGFYWLEAVKAPSAVIECQINL